MKFSLKNHLILILKYYFSKDNTIEVEIKITEKLEVYKNSDFLQEVHVHLRARFRIYIAGRPTSNYMF